MTPISRLAQSWCDYNFDGPDAETFNRLIEIKKSGRTSSSWNRCNHRIKFGLVVSSYLIFFNGHYLTFLAGSIRWGTAVVKFWLEWHYVSAEVEKQGGIIDSAGILNSQAYRPNNITQPLIRSLYVLDSLAFSLRRFCSKQISNLFYINWKLDRNVYKYQNTVLNYARGRRRQLIKTRPIYKIIEKILFTCDITPELSEKLSEIQLTKSAKKYSAYFFCRILDAILCHGSTLWMWFVTSWMNVWTLLYVCSFVASFRALVSSQNCWSWSIRQSDS